MFWNTGYRIHNVSSVMLCSKLYTAWTNVLNALRKIPRLWWTKKTKMMHFSRWDKEFLVVNNDINTGRICLLFHASLSEFREANCQRNYSKHHNVFGKEYPRGSEARVYKIDNPKSQLRRQQKVFCSATPITSCQLKCLHQCLINTLSMTWHFEVGKL